MKTLSLDEIEVQLALGLTVQGVDLEELRRYTYGVRHPETLEAFYRRLQKIFFTPSADAIDRYYMVKTIRGVLEKYVVCHKYCTAELRDEIITQHFLGKKSSWPKYAWFGGSLVEEVAAFARLRF